MRKEESGNDNPVKIILLENGSLMLVQKGKSEVDDYRMLSGIDRNIARRFLSLTDSKDW